MANRRMMSIAIINSARFLKMPQSTQNLYFHLNLRADDDGVVEAYNVMRMTGNTEDDLKILAAKGFITVLNEDLVSHITDWHEHNRIRSDRKVDSIYKDLLVKMLPDVEIQKKTERADREAGTSHGQSTDSRGKGRVGKGRVGKGRVGEDNIQPSAVPSLAISNYKDPVLKGIEQTFFDARVANGHRTGAWDGDWKRQRDNISTLKERMESMLIDDPVEHIHNCIVAFMRMKEEKNSYAKDMPLTASSISSSATWNRLQGLIAKYLAAEKENESLRDAAKWIGI